MSKRGAGFVGAEALNKFAMSVDIADLSADTVYYVVVPFDAKLVRLDSVIDGAVSSADVTITPSIGGTDVTNGAITIATSASAAGDQDYAEPTAANYVAANGAVKLTVAGGGSGGSPRGHVTLTFDRAA